MSKRRSIVLACAGALLLSGCVTAFSPEMIRDEIVRQRGTDPLESFEFELGRFTTLLLKSALGSGEQTLPFDGLAGLQLAVFETEQGESAALDVTRIPVRGWEKVVRLQQSARSGLVLVRKPGGLRLSGGDAGTIGDLVVVGSGRRQVIYARLWGHLDADLPSRLGEVLESGGPEALRSILSGLGGEEAGPSGD